ncbi:DUF2625 family protein [Jatrophihabitans sp. YIM 134969]
MSERRTAADLRDVPDPAWPAIAARIREAGATVLPAAADRRDAALEQLQVTTRSPLGAMTAETGAVRVDHGWLTLLGAGTADLPGIAEASPRRGDTPPPWLVVAFDALGGRFAINGGGLDAEPGEVCHFGVDTLGWVGIGGGYGEFVEYVLTGGLAEFAADLRWPGWEEEVDALEPGQGIAVYPFPFTEEGADVGGAARRPVPLHELHEVYADLARQLSMVPDGGTFDVETR